MVRRTHARDLRGRVVAITGAARGIGLATARLLVSHGARVAIGDIDGERARRAADEIGAYPVTVDVTKRTAVADFLDVTEERLGPVDTLVANAGVMALWPLVDEPAEVTDRQLDVNVRGALHCAQEALPRFAARGRGHLVLVSSVLGKAGLPGAAVYAATKHAVTGLAHAARREAPRRVDVSVVAPSLVATELAAGVHRRGLVPVLHPDDVAAGIVRVLRRPRPELVLPRWLGALLRTRAVLPAPAVEGIVAAMGAHRVLRDPDPAVRARYDGRAFRR